MIAALAPPGLAPPISPMSSSSRIIAFLGGGNMASSLVGGLLVAGHVPSHIRVFEPDAERAQELVRRFGVVAMSTAAEAVLGAELTVLAVKPQVVREALSGLSLDAGSTLLSIAAGVRIALLRELLGPQLHYVRCMPNTPALLGCGMSGLYAEPGTPPAAREAAQAVLESAGRCCWLDDETALDAVTAVSGSGPAYVFLLAELMQNAGVSLGLPADTAALLARQTVIGAARMLEGTAEAAATLRAQVTSKGGTTEAALRSLESAGIGPIFTEALTAAARRSAELGDALAQRS